MSYHLSLATLAALALHRERCEAKRRDVVREFGTLDHFLSRLQLDTIDSPDDPLLRNFYRLYESIFLLHEEREPIEGFSSVLRFNSSTAIQRDFGPLYEPIVALRDPTTNSMVAAASFTLYAYPHLRAEYGFDASCQLHFICVSEELRGLGLAGHLLATIEAMMEVYAERYSDTKPVRTFMTCEQNNPEKMTPEQIEEDARAALIDPLVRMSWWRRRSFQKLDFTYMQPPLSSSHAPCMYLDYYAKPCNGARGLHCLPAPVLLQHIRRFFFVSVGKLQFDMSTNHEWLQVQRELGARKLVALT